MPGENVTTKFRVDISDLKKNITEANREVKLYRAELKNASAGMAKGEETADSLSKKIEAQGKIVEAEKKKLTALKEELERYDKRLKDGEKTIGELTDKHKKAAEAFGKDSDEAKALAKQLKEAQASQERNAKAADDLRVKIVNQDTAVKNAEGQVKQFRNALDDLQKEEKEVGDEAQKTTDGGLESFAVALGNLAANVITAAVKKLGELGQAALDTANDFDGGRDALVKATGAIGEQADELTKAYSNAAKNVIGDLEDIGATAGEINTRFGYTADALTSATEAFTKFADVTGTDAVTAVQGVSKALTAAGEDADNYATLLDKIAAASQASGISSDKLLDSLTSNGATMRALNYDIDETIALLAQFEKSGVNAESAISGLKKANAAWAKDGKDAREELLKTIVAIKNAKDETAAAQVAFDAFGNKAGQELADAIRSGRFEYQDFIDVVAGSAGTVENTYNETQSAMDKINLAMQGLSVTMGDVTSQMLDKLAPGIDKVIGALGSMLAGNGGEELGSAFEDLFENAFSVLSDALPGILTTGGEIISALALSILDAAPDLVDVLFQAVSDALTGLGKFLPKLTDKLGDVLSELAIVLSENLDPLLDAAGDLIDGLTKALLDPSILAKIIEAVGDIVVAVADALSGEGMTHVLESALIGIAVASLEATLSPELLGAVTKLVTQVIAAVIKIAVALAPQIVGAALILIDELIKTVINADWAGIGTSIIDSIVEGANSVDLSAFWGDWFSGFEDVKRWAQSAGDFLARCWEGIKKAFSDVKSFFSRSFSDAWNAVKNAFSTVGSYFEGVWTTIKSKFTSIGTKIGDAVGGAFKSAVNSVIATVERNLNFIPSSINSMLDTINALPGVNISRMGSVSLPRLAQGGIVNRPTVAQIGEAGDEAVIPLDRNKRGLKALAGALREEMGGAGINGAARTTGGGTIINLTQNNSSPKALSRYDIYRQTKNLLNAVGTGEAVGVVHAQN